MVRSCKSTLTSHSLPCPLRSIPCTQLTKKDLDGDGHLADGKLVKKESEMQARIDALRSAQAEIDAQIDEKRRQLRTMAS